MSTKKPKKNYYNLMLDTVSLLLCVWCGIIAPIAMYPKNIPNHEHISYAQGTLKLSKIKSSKYTTSGTQVRLLTNNKTIEFDCSYAINFFNAECGILDNVIHSSHSNKPARIGWYYQKPFLFHTNSYPQLISLEVDGHLIWSYQQTLDELKIRQKRGYFSSFFAFSIASLMAWEVFYSRKKRQRLSRSS